MFHDFPVEIVHFGVSTIYGRYPKIISFNVNPGLMSTTVYELGKYSSNSHNLILFYGTLPIKQSRGLLIQGWH